MLMERVSSNGDNADETLERLLQAARTAFDRGGLKSIDAETVGAVAGVALTELHRYFRSRDEILVAYLRKVHELVRDGLTPSLGGSPAQAIETLFESVAAFISSPQFRGSPFILAAAEYPDPLHPVRQAITAHRTWLLDLLREILDREPGRQETELTARALLMIYDGTVATGHLADPEALRNSICAAVRGIVGRPSSIAT